MAYLIEYKVKQELTSKEVFSERKVNLENAYKMAIELVRQDPNNEWNQKALAWCLIDLIKKTQDKLYIEQLNNIPEDAYDEVLISSRNKVMRLLNPLNNEINKAKELSQSGHHRESANVYFNLLKQQPENTDLQISFAWELYRLSQEVIIRAPINIAFLKRYFYEYFRLSVEKPIILHRCFLQIAIKLIENEQLDKSNNIDLIDFCYKWNLNNFEYEDYCPRRYKSSEGEEKALPPLALTTFRLVLKQSIEKDNKDALIRFLPIIENKVTEINSDIIWLKWDLVKSYLFLDDTNKALSMVIPILKEKPNEYWIWDCLGDIYYSKDTETSISCYCKALLNQKNISFTAKIKMKLVYYFIYIEDFERAKTELQEIIDYKETNSQRISEEIKSLTSESWFSKIIKLKDNHKFYEEKALLAEQFLYQDLPWIDGVLGDTYEHNDKISRKIFISTSTIPVEISIPENKIRLSDKYSGKAIALKGEWNKDKKFQLYSIKESSVQKDIFPPYLATIDHINDEKGIVHFLIDEKIDTVLALKELAFSVKLYDVFYLKISQHTTKEGKTRYKIKELYPSEDGISPIHLIKSFEDIFTVSNDNGFGEKTDIFIPSHLVKQFDLGTNDIVKGRAVKNYNKMKNTWGWRAFEILNVVKGKREIYNFDDGYDEY